MLNFWEQYSKQYHNKNEIWLIFFRSHTDFHFLTQMRFKLAQILSFKTSYSRFNIWQFIMIPEINANI